VSAQALKSPLRSYRTASIPDGGEAISTRGKSQVKQERYKTWRRKMNKRMKRKTDILLLDDEGLLQLTVATRRSAVNLGGEGKPSLQVHFLLTLTGIFLVNTVR
jgi:hypothetical protein